MAVGLLEVLWLLLETKIAPSELLRRVFGSLVMEKLAPLEVVQDWPGPRVALEFQHHDSEGSQFEAEHFGLHHHTEVLE